MVEYNNIAYGRNAESLACEYLQKKGLKLITQNFHTHCGEIDLIMQDSDGYIFIEVRMRTCNDYGSPLESVTYSKQKKIIKTALLYLQKHRLLNKVNCRFDVVAIEQNGIQWIRNAFTG